MLDPHAKQYVEKEEVLQTMKSIKDSQGKLQLCDSELTRQKTA